MGKNQDVAPIVDYVSEEKVVDFAEVTPKKAGDKIAD